MPSQEGSILVVDDQPNWRLALSALLKSEGFAVTQARNFEDAKAILVSSVFDVAVLDVRLVDEDIFNVEGLELLGFVRANSPATRVIILTGYPEGIKRELEADAFILKVPKGSTFDSVGFTNLIREFIKDTPAGKSQSI